MSLGHAGTADTGRHRDYDLIGVSCHVMLRLRALIVVAKHHPGYF
ncbi:uncharacterized protein METZ01_LOCUS274026, partial [marine metagenome]